MIKLPSSTNVSREIPKEIFYQYLNNTPTLKKTVIDDIQSIIWMNRFSPETIAIPQGKHVTEIAVVEIVLKRQAISPNILELLVRETERYTVFITRYEEWGQIWCCANGYRDNPEAEIKCNIYYQTNWMLYEDLELSVKGQDLDQVYENILSQIAGKHVSLETVNPEKEPLKKTAEREEQEKLERLKSLEAAINKLEYQIDHEKQFSRQLKLTGDLLAAKEEMQKMRAPRMTHMEILQPIKTEQPQNTMENVRSFFPNVVMNIKDGSGNRFDYH